MSRTRIRKPATKGFSLIETLIATIVLQTGLVGTLYLLGNATWVQKDADLALHAAEFGSQLLMEAEAVGYNGAAEGSSTVPWIGGRGMTGTVTTTLTTNPNAATVVVTVNWNDSHGNPQVRTFTSTYSQAPCANAGGACINSRQCCSPRTCMAFTCK